MELKSHEMLFVSAGVLTIFSLPWIEGAGYYTWIAAKLFYFAGVVFFIIDTKKQTRT